MIIFQGPSSNHCIHLRLSTIRARPENGHQIALTEKRKTVGVA